MIMFYLFGQLIFNYMMFVKEFIRGRAPMLFIRNYLVPLLVFSIVLNGSLKKCQGRDGDSLKIIVADFNSQKVNEELTDKIPRLLEKEIGYDERFHTLKRDTSKQREKTFQYDFKTLSFDTLILNKLREHRQIDVVILGKIVWTADSIFIATKSLSLKNYSILDSSSISFSTVDVDKQLNNRLSELASSIKKNLFNFNSQRKIREKFTIVFTPFPISESDSLLKIETDSFIEQIINTLNKQAFENIECLFEDLKETASDVVQIDSEALAQSFGKETLTNVVVWWHNCEVNEKQVSFCPSITMLNSMNLNLSGNTQQKVLASALGQLNLVKLPQQSDFNIYPLVDFLTGVVFFNQEKFSDAIDAFSKIKQQLSESNFFINYYLADSFVRRGKIQAAKISAAKADFDSASNYYLKCLNDSNLVENKENMVWVFNNLGVVSQLKGDLDGALDFFLRSLNKKKSLGIDGSIVRIYNNIGNIYLYRGEWKKALDIFQTGIVSMEELGDKENLSVTYDNMGNIYQLILQRSNAITYYQKSLTIRQELGDELGVADSYCNLGDVYLDKKDYVTALDYYQKEHEINERLHNEPRIARSYYNMGDLYQLNGELNDAMIYFQKSLDLSKMICDDRRVISASNQLAAVYYRQKNLEKSLELYESSMALAEERADEPSLAKIYDHIADIYNNEQKWEEALDYYEKSAQYHEKLNYNESLTLILYNMGLIHLKQNRYSEGYSLMKRAIEIDEQHGFNNLQKEKDFIESLKMMIEDGN